MAQQAAVRAAKDIRKEKNFPAQGQMSSMGEQSEGKRQTCCEKECQRSQRAGRAADRISQNTQI